MRNIHIIFRYVFSKEFDQFDFDVMGAFSSVKKANEALKVLPRETENTFYDILSIPLNEIIGLKSFPEAPDDLDHEELSLTIEMMVKDGLVEPLVGEDGEFYFVLTKEGKNLVGRKKKRDDDKGGRKGID